MIPDLRTARERWLKEKDSYEALSEEIAQTLEQEIRRRGIYAPVIKRVKDTASLLKKLIRKGCAYDQIADKAGVRIVVRFKQDVQAVQQIVENAFRVLRKEDKGKELGFNEVDYQAIHYQVTPRATSDVNLRERECEIQVRTLCQDLWAKMDHELSYKPAVQVPEDAKRQIYLLNAMLEVADRTFSHIRETLSCLPGAHVMQLLQSLERHFYRFAGETYDPELSQQVLDYLAGLYTAEERNRLHVIIDEFVQENASKLQEIYDQYLKVQDRPLFLLQPEGLLILERLEKDPHVLEEHWVQRFPREELEELGIAWGTPLD